jgi:hypothetical protein
MSDLYLNEKDCPEIKKYKPGDECDFIIHAKMISRDKFEILDIESPGSSYDDGEMDRQTQMRLEEKARSY